MLLVVANDPWQKAPVRAITPAEDRWAMVVAAARGVDGIEASRLEIDRGGPSYTIDTVEELRRQAEDEGRPEPELFVVVGVDLVGTLPTWERADDLRRLVTLVVVSRPHTPEPPVPPGWRSEHVEGGGVDVSSSEVRTLLRAGKSVNGLVPKAVIRCIQRRSLYAVGR
jgi:nicotinate-nucleotide adenylyltransferase